jgi:TPR repeat protein
MASLRRNGVIGLLALVLATPAYADDLEATMAARMGNYPAAVAQWSAAAREGDPQAAYHLAQAYDRGQGVQQDQRQADYWYRRAASAGSPEAAYALGVEAENAERPDGTPQDLDAAIGWYRRALAGGDERARARLAALGAGQDERPVPRPHPTPARIEPPVPAPAPRPVPHPPTATAPDANFDRALGIWRAHGLDGTDSTAIAALVAAAKEGQPLAEYDLAYAYEHGLGVPAEPVRAYAWYRQAATSNGPERLRKAAETNAQALGAKLSDTQKQTAQRVDTQ